MKKPGETNTPSPATPSVNAAQQIQQMRKNIKAQVDELKTNIQAIQQNSLKNLQAAVDSSFKKMAAGSSEELSKQDEEIKEQIAAGIQNTKSVSGSTNSSDETNYTESPLPDGGKKAIKQASYGALEAMKSAESSVLAAQQLLNQVLNPVKTNNTANTAQ